MVDWTDGYCTVADGLRLHYRDYSGPSGRPPILCLPGLTRNVRDFEPLAERLAGEWRVIALEFRGRGLSDYDQEPERYHAGTYASDVIDLLDSLAIPKAVLAGTSLGGIVTMILAATHHDRLAGALINDIGPEICDVGLARLRTYVGKPASFASWSEAARAVAEINGQAYPAYGDTEWERFARRLCREQEGSIGFDYDLAIARVFEDSAGASDLWPLVDALRGFPVTILRGELSDIFTADVAQRMAATLPDAELVTVPGVGHAPVLDEPEAAAAVDRLLERVLRVRR
jgi:pimeloyl-ACP methyl ester carboxylesterase